MANLKTKCFKFLTLIILLHLSVSSVIPQVVSGQEEESGGHLDDANEFAGGQRMAPGSGTTVKKALGTELPPAASGDEEGDLLASGPLPEAPVNEQNSESGDISQLMPQTLFNKDAADPSTFNDIDCHLRNLDLCYAGLLGAGVKLLPETDAELEARCDEMKAMMSCISVYNQRCQSLRLLSNMMPMSQLMGSSRSIVPKEIQEIDIPLDQLDNANQNKPRPSTPIRAIDLMELCEPAAKRTEANKKLRQRLFQLSKCISPKMQSLKPCIEDLKAALQLFYEPGRFLPLEPSCCAISRFRSCAQEALDGICGISSFAQLESSLNSGPGGQMMSTLTRTCRRRASSHETSYCQETLPARGVRVPERRGRKASKLARVLDMFSFAQ